MIVLLTATVQSHICQFHKPLVEMLHEHGCEIHVAARDNLAEKNGLKLDFVDKVFDVSFNRSPKSLENIKAYKQLKRIIENGDYDVIHCNTPMGGIITRLAARKARKHGTKVFYTAHGFHFYKGAPKKNWLIYYPIEKFFAGHYTDVLITINCEDYLLSKQKMNCKIAQIHGVGVYANRFHSLSLSEVIKGRERENLKPNDFVVLTIGELLPNKNQKILIDAINICVDRIPNIKLLVAGNGPNKNKLEKQIEELNLQKNVYLLGYRTDLDAVIPLVDIVASASIREGLGLNVIEGMLCSKPIVASRNRGHCELVEDAKNGFLVDSCSAEQYADSFVKCYLNDCSSLGENSLKRVQLYCSDNTKRELFQIYHNEGLL